METRRRTVETSTPCPHCGGKLHMRQFALRPPEAHEWGDWRDEHRFCLRGCRYTADEVVE